MQGTTCTPTEIHGKHPTYKPHNLPTTGFVYICHNPHSQPLQWPYIRPFKILETAEKKSILDNNVSVDWLSLPIARMLCHHHPQPVHECQSLIYTSQPKEQPLPTFDARVPMPTLCLSRPIRPHSITVRNSALNLDIHVIIIIIVSTFCCFLTLLIRTKYWLLNAKGACRMAY